MENFTSILSQLQPIFRDVFDDESLVVNNQTTAPDVDGWDSLSHIRLVVSIEKAFGLRFSHKEIAGLKNVGDMTKLIAEKTVHG